MPDSPVSRIRAAPPRRTRSKHSCSATISAPRPTGGAVSGAPAPIPAVPGTWNLLLTLCVNVTELGRASRLDQNGQIRIQRSPDVVARDTYG